MNTMIRQKRREMEDQGELEEISLEEVTGEAQYNGPYRILLSGEQAFRHLSQAFSLLEQEAA